MPYNITINGGANITNLNGLGQLTSIGGSLLIFNNTGLNDLAGLNSLTTVSGSFFLSSNPSLTDVYDLSALTYANAIIVTNNASLTSLSGLDGAAFANGGLYISQNPQLSVCNFPNICYYLSNPANAASIFDNATGCADRQEIEAACPPPLTCKSNVLRSINDNTCQAMVTVSELLEGGPYNPNDYYIEFFVSPISGPPVASGSGSITVTSAHVGTPLTFRVTKTADGNFCEGPLLVEDAKKPTPYCQVGLVTQIPASGPVVIGGIDLDAGSFDNCGGVTLSVSQNGVFYSPTTDFYCPGTFPVYLGVTDAAGNFDYCQTSIVVQDNMGNAIPPPPTVTCSDNIQFNLGANCQAIVNVFDLLEGGPYGADCWYFLEIFAGPGFTNLITSGYGSVAVTGSSTFPGTPQTLIYRITNTDSGNSCSGTIQIEDHLPPVIVCPPDQTVNFNGDCDPLLPPLLSYSDNCTPSQDIAISEQHNVFTSPGVSMDVTYTAYDYNSNAASCQFTVFINNIDPLPFSCPGNQSRNVDLNECDYTTVGQEFDFLGMQPNCAPLFSFDWTLSGATTGTGTGSLAGVDFLPGNTLVQWSAVGLGSSASCSFTVTVNVNVEICNGIDDDCDGLVDEGFSSTYQAPGIAWQKTIGGSNIDILFDLEQTTDGGYILTGWSSSNISGDKTENRVGLADFWVVKLDASGNIIWQNNIGGTDQDYALSIQQTTDGGYIVGGFSASNISGDKTQNSKGEADMWVVKLDGSGNIIWQKTIGGAGQDFLEAVRQTTDGGYILGGSSASNISGDKTENSQGLFDYWIVKLDASGNIVWQNTIGGSGSEHCYDIKQTVDGGYIAGGSSTSSISGDKTENSQGSTDYWAVKLDANGNIQWQNTLGGGGSDDFWKLETNPDGSCVLGGFSVSGASGDKTEVGFGSGDYWIIKLDVTGNIVWQNTIGGNNGDQLYDIQRTSDGNYILGGFSSSGISGDKTEASKGDTDYWVVKIDANGNVLWDKTIGGSGGDRCLALRQTADGGYIIGGDSYSNLSGDKTENSHNNSRDYWVVKLGQEVLPTIEICNGIDDDCDGLVDLADPDLIPHPDFAALMAFYNATNGPAWTNNSGWGTDCNVCNWHGVTCDGNGRVIQLYLQQNNLSGNLPTQIENLTELQFLNLSDNALTGSIPAQIGNLSNLLHLELSGNSFSGSIPGSSGNLANLQLLNLSTNTLTNTIPTQLGNLTNLYFLGLSSNNLSGNIPSVLGNLTNLQTFELSGNNLSGSIPASLGNLTNLQVLGIAINNLSGPIPPQLGNLSSLIVLILNDNQLSGCFPATLTPLCSQLVFHNISNNPGLPGGGDFAAFCANGTGGDADGDGYCSGTGAGYDCDDNNPAVHPGASELCNGIDDNCNVQIDEGNVCCPPGPIVYVKANATGLNNGTSWTDAYTNLQTALTSTCPGITQIWVAAGTYKPTSGTDRYISFVMKNNLAIYGGFDGTETLLTQRNWVSNVTVLSGDIGVVGTFGDNSYHVIFNYNLGLNSTAILDGFTITKANADDNSFINGQGGGMYNHNSSPIINNCTFSGNFANGGGGLFGDHSSPLLNNCTFSGNHANYGGGIHNYYSSSPIIVNSTFLGNIAMEGSAIYSFFYTFETITNCSFTGNFTSVAGGGVVYNWLAFPSLKNSIIWGNSSGVVNVNGSSPTYTNTIVQGLNLGGGVFNGNTDPLFVNQPNFNNAPTTVGDLHLQGCSPAIDAGMNTGAPANDLDGNPRPFDGDGNGTAMTDLGAFEYQSVSITWYKDQDNDGYSDGTTKVHCNQPNGYKTAANLSATSGDCQDGAGSIVGYPNATTASIHPNATEVCNGIDDDCDGLVDEGLSGLTYNGTVVFTTMAQLSVWPSCYTKINGSLFISGGNIGNIAALANLSEVTGNISIQNTKLSDLSGLNNLATIGGFLLIKSNNAGSGLTSLNGLQGLATIGGYLEVFKNNKLTDCCPIEHLLLYGGINGTITIAQNKTGCDNVTEVLNSCPLLIGGGGNQNQAVSSPCPGCPGSLESSNYGIFLFPNPAPNTVTLRFSNGVPENGSVQITDVFGKLLQSEAIEISEQSHKLSVEGLPAGMYFVRVMEGGISIWSEKLIKQ